MRFNQNYINEWYYARCGGISGVPFVDIGGSSGNIYANDGNMRSKPLQIRSTSEASSAGDYVDVFKPSSQVESEFSKTNFTEGNCGVISSGHTTTSQWSYNPTNKELVCMVAVNATSDIVIKSFALYEQAYTTNPTTGKSAWVTGIIGMYYLDNPITLNAGQTATVVISFSTDV